MSVGLLVKEKAMSETRGSSSAMRKTSSKGKEERVATGWCICWASVSDIAADTRRITPYTVDGGGGWQ